MKLRRSFQTSGKSCDNSFKDPNDFSSASRSVRIPEDFLTEICCVEITTSPGSSGNGLFVKDALRGDFCNRILFKKPEK